MRKKDHTTASGQHTAETVVTVINALPPAERRKLVDLLVEQPENDKANIGLFVGALNESSERRRCLAYEKTIWVQRELLEMLHEQLIELDLRLSRVEAELRDAEADRDDAQDQTANYRRGPKAKKKRNADLLKAIHELLESGVSRDPCLILKNLEQMDQVAHLIHKKNGKKISVKTIANKLAKL